MSVNCCHELMPVLEAFVCAEVGMDMYREWKKVEFPKQYCI
jgi:hypothetical protein